MVENVLHDLVSLHTVSRVAAAELAEGVAPEAASHLQEFRPLGVLSARCSHKPYVCVHTLDLTVKEWP